MCVCDLQKKKKAKCANGLLCQGSIDNLILYTLLTETLLEHTTYTTVLCLYN